MVPDCQSAAVVKGLCVKHQLLSAREITTMERRLGRPMTEEEERLRLLQEAQDPGMV